ncbi:hypothetical protein ACW7BC_29865 [Azospirillum argentinense]
MKRYASLSVLGVVFSASCFFLVGTATQALADDCDAAKEVAQLVCASGDRIDVKASGEGKLTLFRLTPGGSAEIKYTKSREYGSLIPDPKYIIPENENIRTCMKDHVDRLYKACLSKKEPILWRSEVISTAKTRGDNLDDRRCWPAPEGYRWDFSSARMAIAGLKGWFSNDQPDNRYNAGKAIWEKNDKNEICVYVLARPTLRDAYAQSVGQVEVTAVP